LSVDLYSGWTHSCEYCYVPQTLKVDRKKIHENVIPEKDSLKRFKTDADEMAKAQDDHEILFSFSCDPYPEIEAEKNITRQAMEILKKNKLRFTILTKAGTRAVKGFDLLKGYDKASFGATLFFTPKKTQINGNQMQHQSKIVSMQSSRPRRWA